MNWLKTLFGGGNSEIEELKTRANAFIQEYPRKTSRDQLERAYGHYGEAYRIFMKEFHKTGTEQSALDRLEDALMTAMQAAADNALLFYKCADLLVACRSHVTEAQSQCLDETMQRLGAMWPDMMRSYAYHQQTQRSGFLLYTLPRIGSGVTVQHSISAEEPANRASSPGLESVKACPFNPNAWFSLRFEMHQRGSTADANTFKALEESLNVIQGRDILDAITKSS